jgi:dTDP-4-amino-4,6-dideoxygalactose transaminase
MTFPSWPISGDREEELLQSVLKSPQWGGFHPLVQEFEQRFACGHDTRFGVSAFNGTVTLELALEVLGVGAGHEVIVPAISFVATASAVSRVGATPVFVDIGPSTFNIDPDRIEDAITPRTKAIIAVHFGAAFADVERINQIARDHSLWFIEDAAHLHGGRWKGRGAGSFGIAGSFSFQNGKVMCSGEGGILVSNDEAFADRARSIANSGRCVGESFYKHFTLGTNLRMTAFQAAVLTAQWERLEDQIARRTANARAIKALLANMHEITWQDEPPQITRSSWYLLCGRFRSEKVSRDQFCASLTAQGVPCTPFYPHTLYQNPMYQYEDCIVAACPNAEAYLSDAFWLPHRVLLAEPEVMPAVAEAFRRASKLS